MNGDNDTTEEIVDAPSENNVPDVAPDTGEDAPESSKESDADAPESTPDDTEDDEDVEPPTRKPRTNADWVALRRQRKLEKQSQTKDRGDDVEEDDDEDMEDISPEDAKVISKVVERKLQPFMQQQEEQQLQSEINDFAAKNPEFKPFVAKAAKWAGHPTWKNVPTEQLMYAVAGKQLLTIGAKRREAADRKINGTKMAGNSSNNSQSNKGVWDMTDAEFNEQLEQVKSRA